MQNQTISQGITWIGVKDFTTDKFDGMWPIKGEGMNLNAYIVEGDEKTALIDAVKCYETNEYLENIRSVIGDKKPDYIIVNHMEPDHTSSLQALLNEYPDLTIVGNKKSRMMLKNFYDITDNYLEIEDGGSLDLGNRELRFYFTPMVHWPESMVTYDVNSGTLFSMDIFGSFKTTIGSIFADENDIRSFEFPTYRYYASIVAKVTPMAQKALKKLEPLTLNTICPAHGMVWRRPEDIDYLLDLWTRLAYAKTVPGVVITYGTIYGNSRCAAEIIADGVRDAGVKDIIMYNLSDTNISYILADLWKYSGAVFGCPAYYGEIFPLMQNLLYKLKGNKLDNHICGFFTEYSWSGGAEKYFEEFIDAVHADCIGDLIRIQGAPQGEDRKKLYEMGKALGEVVVKGQNELASQAL